ncbi:MAG: FAD-dependent oxidoreductase [Candidatus Sumerlaeota bacterium]|nr:FAD-dependent oxidoreductase [Candidatus Sumerlaeota bacterium]
MDGATRVYLCAGCGIGEAVDLPALKATVEKEFSPEACAIHPCLCGAEGLALVRQELGEAPAGNVVIGACSGRVNTDIFSFGSGVTLERANLREHVAWSQPPKEEDTQALAEDVMRMSIVKARKSALVEPFVPPETSKTILVIGGGIAGLTAALQAARLGGEVVVVEKEPFLGGHMATVHKELPKAPPFRALSDPTIDALIEQVSKRPNIRVFTSARIERISGAPGMFDCAIQRNDESIDLWAGAIVVATGWKPYDASKLTRYGYGLPNVVTQQQIEDMARGGRIVRPSDLKPARRVAFIQCAGQRDPEHLPYCSSVCCMTSLKQALYLREQDPDALAYVIYKDLRAPGLYENFYLAAQENENLCLTRGEVKSVSTNADGSLSLEVENALLGERVLLQADLVVLAVGMQSVAPDGGILRLQYRLGEEQPLDRDGFPNSNFICFPYETRRTGVYAAGCVRSPMTSLSAMTDAAGAALKALQCVTLTAQGAAVHPRANDLSFPDFFLQRCTQCKRCTEECPFGALDDDEKGTPKPNPTRCRRCGICMGACPERIINFANYSIDQVASMIKSIHVPDEFEEKPRVLVLACENDAMPAFDIAGLRRKRWSPHARLIPVRCLGSINVVWISEAFSRGIDGVMMIGCKKGDDYQCHMITGSELLAKRGENVQETLNRLMLEPERVRTETLAIDEYDRIPELIDGFVASIQEMGPNPFKGM